MKAKLAALAADQAVVGATVFDANCLPAKGLTVSIFFYPLAEEVAVGTPTDPLITTSDDGSYSIRYTPPAGGRADIRLQVSSVIAGPAGSASVVLETIPGSASLLMDTGPVEVVDFYLSGPKNPPK